MIIYIDVSLEIEYLIWHGLAGSVPPIVAHSIDSATTTTIYSEMT